MYCLSKVRPIAAVFCLVVPHVAWAQSNDCLEPLDVQPMGELTLDLNGETRTLEFLQVSVADFVLGDVEAFTTAAYLRDTPQINPLFNIWSLTAFPAGYGATLAASLCGEDVLDAFDSFQRLSELGGVLGGALTSVSPSQAALRPLLSAQLQAQASPDDVQTIQDLWADIDAFDAALPDRSGAFQIAMRMANLDPNAILTNTDLAPDEMMAQLNFLESPELIAQLDDPSLMTCPCELDTIEAHLFGAAGPPLSGDSQSWQLADTRNADFTVTLDAVTRNADGTLMVSGSFAGALVAMSVDPEATSPFGLVTVERGDTYAPVSGSFEIPAMMSGSLLRLPKLF
ncbi:hypothetical protein [Yoonia sp. 208BN28-4]|uniref:hypothetical protein n=1 Tax=Yoonia sp. 208BN28-4 TaxID=3126505 RepID=UPI0030B5B450